MNEYVVYFEFYGRKMKTTVQATSVTAAMEQIRNRVEFIKVASATLSHHTGDLPPGFDSIFKSFKKR